MRTFIPFGCGAPPLGAAFRKNMFKQRLLILVPHPDDEVVGCAALIRRAREAGARIFTVLLTTGVPPKERLWPWDRSGYERRVALRMSEFAKSTAALEIEDAGRLEIPSRTLKDHLETAYELIGGAVDAVQPDMLWAPAFEGGHQDHDVANFLASKFRDRTDVWEFSEYTFWGGRVRSNWFPETSRTTVCIELSEFEQAFKRSLLRTYASERGNLGHIDCDRETVRPMPVHRYDEPPHPSPLFYQRFQWVPRHPRVDYCRPMDVARSMRDFASMSSGEKLAAEYK